MLMFMFMTIMMVKTIMTIMTKWSKNNCVEKKNFVEKKKKNGVIKIICVEKKLDRKKLVTFFSF